MSKRLNSGIILTRLSDQNSELNKKAAPVLIPCRFALHFSALTITQCDHQAIRLSSSINEFKQLEFLGLVLPTPAYILEAVLFGIIGWFAFRHGRKKSASVLMWTGVALMLYPYAIS